ncbi:MAG: hypothetical protein M1826_004059 [Phylliscum demangeonii]|nr:MAG: hypothetical protein M1826_004059 [Phylliscum demangeonii]
MAGPSKKKMTKKAAAKKASAPAKKPSTTTKKGATRVEGQPMAVQLEKVTADSHYAVMTRGRGDCMYHAISDQLYGHQNAHAEIRATTAAFLRHHRALYRPFVPADLGAENRRSTRLTRGGAMQDLPPLPTEDELDQAFDSYVERYVEKPGRWGGDLELQALAGAFLVDILVYQDKVVPWRQQPMDRVLPDGHRPEDRKLLRVAYYGGVHYASVRPLEAAAPELASPKRKRTPDGDPEEREEEQEATPRLPDAPASPPPVPEPVAGDGAEERPRKKRAISFEVAASVAASPSSPPVLQRQEQQPGRATLPSTTRPPSKWRSASCPPSKGKAMATAKAKRRPATRQTTPATITIPAPALALVARAVPAVPVAAAAAAADTSPAVPARAPDDDKCRLVHVRLAGIPGGDIFISGLVRGHLTFTRAGEVLAAYAVEEEG